MVAVVAAAAVPAIGAGVRRYSLISSSQQVASTIRSARLQAVANNRTLRVRIDCPSPGTYRVVEVTGNAVIDTAANRCDPVAFPYPAPDADPATLPNLDGPVAFLPQGVLFTSVLSLEISTTGRVVPLGGCPGCAAQAAPASIIMNNGGQARMITVSGSGQVQNP